MNIKQMLKTIALAVGLTSVGAASAGDIFQILPCRESYLGKWDAVSSTDYVTRDGDGKTINAGVDLSFKVRLAPRRPLSQGGKAWRLVNPSGSSINELEQNRLALAIFVGGRQDWATYTTHQTSDDGVLDLIFTYRTKPGDVGLPILMGVKDTGTGLPEAAHRDRAGAELYLKNTDKWMLENPQATEPGATEEEKKPCAFSYFNEYSTPVYNAFMPIPEGGLQRDQDITLRNCGFAVKAVDFASDWESEETVWRTVKQGSSTIASFKDVKLEMSAPADEQVTMYVWSDDESVVRISSNRANTEVVEVLTLQLTMSDGTKVPTKAAKIRFVGGSREARFRLEGVAQNADPVNLVMSTWTDYHYNVSNDRLTDYVTVPVVCGEPERPTIRVKSNKTQLTATADEGTPAEVLTITRTGDYPNPITVTLTPSFECDPTKTDWSDYLRFSTMELDSLPSSTNLPTVTIPGGSAGDAGVSVPLYVYALRADENTKGDGHRVVITPTIDEEVQTAAGITELIETQFNIKAQNPEIIAPTPTSTFQVTQGDMLEIPVEIRDTYADRTDDAGYKVTVKIGAVTTNLDENFNYDDGSLVGKTSKASPTVTVTATAGEQIGKVTVVSPVSGLKAEVSFNVTVIAPPPPKSVSAEVDASVDKIYEGDSVPFSITLSEKIGTVAYAFLVSDDPDIDISMFSDGAASAIIKDASKPYDATNGGKRGIKVGSSQTEVTGLDFTVLDGGRTPGGLNYTFDVVFCSSQSFNPENIVPGYESAGALTLKVLNNAPEIDGVQIDGFAPNAEGIFEDAFPKGQKATISPSFTDADYDLYHGFTYKWTAKFKGNARANGTIKHTDDPTVTEVKTDMIVSAGKQVYTTIVPDGMDINQVPFIYDFPAGSEDANNWTIEIAAWDKDMREAEATTKTVTLSVVDQPKVKITVEKEYLENEAKTSFLTVALGGNLNGDTLVVKLTVTPPAGVNPGSLTLSDAYKAPVAGYPELKDDEYYVTFSRPEETKIQFKDMDGTSLSYYKGITVRAEVVTDGMSLDPTKKWSEYYLADQQPVYIRNVEPVVSLPTTNDNTPSNVFTTAKAITWTVRTDVDFDFTTPWKDAGKDVTGIKVEFSGDIENADTVWVTNANTRQTFTPNFGAQQGPLSLTVTISDKDSEFPQEFTYYYNIPPSKYLTTTATGPSAGISTSALSQKYRGAKGRGAGHTYVTGGANFQNAEAYTLKWNCHNDNSATLYGFGYKQGAIDNGSLNAGFDYAVDKDGNNKNGTKTLSDDESYHYDDPEGLDSFFYCWLATIKSDDGSSTTSVIGRAPEVYGEVAKGDVDLPSQATTDGNYPLTRVEGIFSKEWAVADNLGDINKDAIPDYFAIRTWGGGNLLESETDPETGAVTVADDLRDLAGSNPDEDYLPGCLTLNADGVTFAVNAGSSYAPIGLPFTTRREIRGFADGLNATDVTMSDPDFDEIEQAAWAVFAEANGLDVDKPDLTQWSPEPTGKSGRMDPTLADTDGDGLPDGWEYFFWYSAHVWYPAAAAPANPRPGQKYVYERFNVNNILEGDEIPAEEVEKRFNPCEPLPDNWLASNPDFDNDGLSDLEELVLGTNPTHWDTDGDHMCDGWEVMMSLDPLNGTKTGNADGDFMAYFTTYGTACVEQDGAVLVLPELRDGVDYELGVMIRDVTTKGFRFLPKPVVDAEGNPLLDAEGNPLILTYGMPGDMSTKDSEKLGYGYKMVEAIEPVTVTVTVGTAVETELRYVLIHDQVRDAFGFDPRTAWYKDAFGYVASRWNPAVNKTLSPFDTTGVAVNTRLYNDYDEYLVMKYRQDYGIVYVKNEPAPATTWDRMRAMTTNPSIVEPPVAEENTANDDDDDDNDTDDDDEAKPDRTTVDIMNAVTDAFHAAGSNKTPILGHGADTDGDGVPDGWELYMYRSPNLKPDMSEDGLGPQLKADYDNDQLVYAQEYAGVDSCNAYKGCATIYANHPGIASGWYNKFFPTHPGSINVNDEFLKWAGNADGRDTDGDGVSDFDEGSAWATDFYNDGNVFETKLGFVYATVADDGMTCCFRGAGMNPCTVDTDQDGLPDGWEMQHAGVPVNAATLTPVMPRGVLADEFGEITIAPSTFIADGLTAPLAAGNGGTDADGNAVAAPAVIYIAGGMDATWPGDAMTDGAVKGKSYDELLQRDRDVDFDHDGLQNFQEYLVQSMRHFRYDDTTTPLMGRVLDETGAERKQTFLGYMPFDSASPLDPEQMRELGYFASPAHAWDRAVTSGNFMDPVYMAPATGVIDSFANCAGYVSTDPRMADTDGDSMDDFYEMFHGLNPILGMDPDDDPLMMTAWVGGKKGDIISAVYATAYYPNVTPLLTYNAYWNPWIMPDYDLDEGRAGGDPGTARFGSIQAPEAYDPILYPWIMGSPLADADGDGIRNVNEAVKANVVSPEPLHSDPTPLWFTDATTPASYVAQYYGAPERVASMAAQVWLTESSQPLAYLYNFEEGEGYDTDNDMVPDSREVTTTATRASDILRYDDPNRRQALWFNGTDGFAMTPDGQFRPSQAQDLFKQFTVECWINPEMTGADQTILDRSCAYAGNAINKDSYAIRANYRIGLDKDGRVYGMFDNDDAIESGKNNPISCQRVYGTQLPLNKWSHVALTYDGKALRIYVNGRLLKSEGTSLMPANGTLVAQQNIGSTNMLENVEYTFTPGFLYIGARPQADALNALPAARPNMDAVGSDSFKEFFKGYVDEVRIWDGARTSEEIGQNYLRRLSFDAVKANRDAVYASSVSGGTRNDNDGMPMLPPELIYHYNFSTLPGALNANDVAKTPIGFTANVLGAAMNDYVSNDNIDTTGLYVDADMSIKGGADGAVAGDLLIGWWANCPAHSKVYDDYHVIPWIENTVGHLPRIDGGCVDSVLYNEQTGGSYMPAAVFGLQKYTFPNSAMPYASVVGDLDVDQRDFAARRGAELIGGPLVDVYNRFQFSENAKFFASTDLVPMGGAFAKSCMAMWDGSASDNWEYTGSDEDADGLPDWWEEYARNNYCENVDPSEPLNWDTLVTYRGMQMTASQAYLIDIALGLQPDGTVNEDLASRADDDHNGIPDWWEKIFGVDGEGQFADSDNDGLSNYAEYLLSFVFDLGQIFDPGNAHSVNANDIDYFFPIGSLYAGEIFTDNDMMEDTWEAKYGNKYVNPFVWDANSDKDEDGWSAFAECRYANFVSEIVADKVSHMLGDAEMKDYPVPTIKLSLRYNQSQPLNGGADAQGGNNGGQNGNDTALNQEENSLAPIIVKTYTHKDGEQYDNVVPDAVFKVQPGESIDRSLYLGAYADRIVRGTLTPGYVDGGTFDMEFYPMPQNDHYTWSETDANGQIAYYGGTYEDYMYAYRTYGPDVVQLTAGAAEWVRFADQGAFTVTRDGESNKGYICFMGERAGEIDLVSGEFSFDMSMCERWILEGTNTMVNIASSVFRINYTSKIPVLQQKKLDLFLGTPNTGSVREGRNRIVAFYDIDGDGDYTPGEPLGFDDNVEVSWKQGAAEIELTDTTPVVTRLKLQSVGEADGEGEGSGVASDRFVLWGTEDGDHHDVIPGELSGGDYQRVRLVRTLVNGRPAPNRVVADTIIHLKQRPFLFEGDVLSENELDLDWSTFQRDVVNNAAFSTMDITNVTYRIVLGNGTIDMEQTNNLFVVATVRHFDPKGDRIRPTLVSPGVGGDSIVYGARPTFKWTMGKFNTYTAFKLQIMKSGSVVWDSGVRKAPARDSYNNYTFVPDVYLGDVLEPGVKYTWNVSMYNAKFRDDAPSTSAQTFVMNEGGAGYGSIDVCVKYFGPSLNAGTIRVEAFETPDFTGAPVARATVKDTTDVGTFGVEHEANAKLVGLPAGQYYVRAYLDLKGHGKTNAKDAWESWGYACPREGSAQMFNPSTIVIAADSVAGRVIDVYVEDVDTNGNNLPDAWEVATRGSVDNGAGNVTEVLTGGVVVNQALAGGLAEREDATSVPGGLAAQVMMTLASPSFQAMVFDVEVPEGGSLAATLADATEVVDGSVAITDAQFDQAKKTVTLTVEADVENAYKNTLGGALYTFDASSATVNCTVWRKATLAESGWTKVVVKPVTVGREAAKVVVDLSKADFGEGGFFKVTVEK